MPALILDFDGVIVDSESLQLEAFNKALWLLGIRIEISEKEWGNYIGFKPIEIARALRKCYIEDFDIHRLVQIKEKIFTDSVNRIQLVPDIENLINIAKFEGWKVGIATSSHQESIIHQLITLGLRDLFDAIVTGDLVKRSKPFPEIFLLAATYLEVEPKECVVVEDTLNGLLAAKAAGMKCVLYPSAFVDYSSDFTKADYIVRELSQLNKDLLLKFVQSGNKAQGPSLA